MKHRFTFEFIETEEKAKTFCKTIEKGYSYYMKKHHPVYYTPWSSQDGKENCFVVFYYI